MRIVKAVRDKTKEDVYMCNTLLNMFKRGELRKDHPLQRKPEQWLSEVKSGFISTVIKHEDVDSIKICEQINGQIVILWLIDGIQRLTTIEYYRKNLFALSKNLEFPIIYYQTIKRNEDGSFMEDEKGNLSYDIVEYDLRGKYFKDLPEELKEKFDNYPIDVVKHLDCSDEEIGYHIRRYNRQTSMNASQNTITYMDSVAKYLKKISNHHRFFADCGNYTECEKKKNIIDRVVSESIMSIFHLDNWKKGKSMGAYLNKNSSKDEFDTYNNELDRLSKIIDKDTTGRLFNSKNSFIWFALFHRFTLLNIDDKRFSDFLKAFMSELHSVEVEELNASFDDIDSNRATKDKSVIVKKINCLELLMNKFLKIDINAFEDNIPVIEFVKGNVDSDVTEEDIKDYEEDLEVLTLGVDNTSKLLEPNNHNSLVAIISYTYQHDLIVDDWFVDFFERNSTYNRNQKENYIYMKEDLENFLRENKRNAS